VEDASALMIWYVYELIIGYHPNLKPSACMHMVYVGWPGEYGGGCCLGGAYIYFFSSGWKKGT
jgi:hypothetical protein